MVAGIRGYEFDSQRVLFFAWYEEKTHGKIEGVRSHEDRCRVGQAGLPVSIARGSREK